MVTLPMLLYSLLSIIVIQVVFFIFAALFKTDKVTDLSYGLTFPATVLLLLLLGGNYGISNIILFCMILLWGLRLGVFLFIRVLVTKRDRRFDGVRENFKRFLTFWTLQAATIFVVLLPATFMLEKNTLFNPLQGIGIFIFLAGFVVETIADFQKFTFKNNPTNHDKFINTGLWKYARHPNYFGEMLVWCGVFLYTLPTLSGYEFISIVSPLYIWFLLRYVSGVPPLEKRYSKIYKDNRSYQDYKKSTRLLVPLPK